MSPKGTASPSSGSTETRFPLSSLAWTEMVQPSPPSGKSGYSIFSPLDGKAGFHLYNGAYPVFVTTPAHYYPLRQIFSLQEEPFYADSSLSPL